MTNPQHEALRAALKPFAEKAKHHDAKPHGKYPARDSFQITHRLGDFRRAAEALEANGPKRDIYRHKKTGGLYERLWPMGNIQSDTPLRDMDQVVIYRSEKDGSLWARKAHEFVYEDRFEPAEAYASLEKEMLDRPVGEGETFQQRVDAWMQACFGPEISSDCVERNHRFLEEALELVQSIGCTQSEAHQLVDYVYGRDQGEVNQEVGGVMVTLAALCLANGLDMAAAGETELARVWTKIDKIRAKQAAKPKHSPLPTLSRPVVAEGWRTRVDEALNHLRVLASTCDDGDVLGCGRIAKLIRDLTASPIADGVERRDVLEDAEANKAMSELIRFAVGQAMLDAWNEICADTDCHPLDITRHGRKLEFHPRHWADQTAAILERLTSDQFRALASPTTGSQKP